MRSYNNTDLFQIMFYMLTNYVGGLWPTFVFVNFLYIYLPKIMYNIL